MSNKREQEEAEILDRIEELDALQLAFQHSSDALALFLKAEGATMHMIETNRARAYARLSNMFCRVSADRNRLVFYTGDEAQPGTWLEAGSTLIDTSRGGAAFVSRHAVELITAKPAGHS